MDKKAFGQKLRNIRKLRKLTQEALAEAIDIDLRQVVRLEAGECLPSLENFIKLTRVLEVTPNELLNLKPENQIKSDIYDLLSLAKDDQLVLIKELILAIM